MRWMLVAMMLGCGGRVEWSDGDPMFHGALVVVEQDAAPYVTDPDFRARLARVIDLSVAYLGHDPAELAGLRILIVESRFDCGDVDAVGCYTATDNTIRFAAASTCVENSVLPHELAHYFQGGAPGHPGPEFRLWFFRALWTQIHDGTGGDCERFKSDYAGQWAGPF